MSTNSDNSSINSNTSSDYSSTTSDSDTTSTESRSQLDTQSTLSKSYSASGSDTSVTSSLNSTDLDIPDIDFNQYHNNANPNSATPSSGANNIDNTHSLADSETDLEDPKIDFSQYPNNIGQNSPTPNGELSNSNTNTGALSNSESTISEAPKIDFSQYPNNTNQNSLSNSESTISEAPRIDFSQYPNNTGQNALMPHSNLSDTDTDTNANVKSNSDINIVDSIKLNTNKSSATSAAHDFTGSNDALHNDPHDHSNSEDYTDNTRNTNSHLDPDYPPAQTSTVQSSSTTPDTNTNTVNSSAQPSSIASNLLAQLQATIAQTKTHIITHHQQRLTEKKISSTHSNHHYNSRVRQTPTSTVAQSTQPAPHQEANTAAVPPVQSPAQHIVTAVALETIVQSQSTPKEIQPNTQPINISQIQNTKHVQPTVHNTIDPTVKHTAITQSNDTASKKRSTSNKCVVLKPKRCSSKPTKICKYEKSIRLMLDNMKHVHFNYKIPPTSRPTQPNYSSKILHPIEHHTRSKMI